MARKKEPGIQYYSMEADHTSHPKIRLVFNEFGADGYWVWSCLLDRIYKIKGYYYDTRDQDDLELFASESCRLPMEIVRAVIEGCLRRDLFDQGVFQKYQVLTSDRIQLTYLKATEERRRKGTDIEMIEGLVLVSEDIEGLPYNHKILLISTEQFNSSTEIKNNSTEVPWNNPQSKVKYSKVKESKVDKSIVTESDDSKKYSIEDREKFKMFQDWILKYAPMVSKMEEPFTIDQYLKLKKRHLEPKVIQDYLIKMHNWKPLLKKNRSAYLTLLNWDRMQKQRDGDNVTTTDDKQMVM